MVSEHERAGAEPVHIVFKNVRAGAWTLSEGNGRTKSLNLSMRRSEN